ncbi:hypothetical protein CYMTET_3447 [Cymbomonas tetramitiformis]|uniref:Uncharacterized protein n=1 Tax=Cymbomonas tetramitiformis TaxID=36881 RepID=A0AAE0H3E5_9CHLO|nr:hypothetical protein CYMTET_3447 [Cymbomonas tetramitiformis]
MKPHPHFTLLALTLLAALLPVGEATSTAGAREKNSAAAERDARAIRRGLVETPPSRHPENPRRMAHRFRHLSESDGKLLDVNYEVERAEHVIVLHEHDDVEELRCYPISSPSFQQQQTGSSPPPKAQNGDIKMQIKLGWPSDVVFKNGSIISVSDPWSCPGTNPDKKDMLQRVVAAPTVIRRDLVSRTYELVTVPAELHECFESSKLYFFQGEMRLRPQAIASLEPYYPSNQSPNGMADEEPLEESAYQASGQHGHDVAKQIGSRKKIPIHNASEVDTSNTADTWRTRNDNLANWKMCN